MFWNTCREYSINPPPPTSVEMTKCHAREQQPVEMLRLRATFQALAMALPADGMIRSVPEDHPLCLRPLAFRSPSMLHSSRKVSLDVSGATFYVWRRATRASRCVCSVYFSAPVVSVFFFLPSLFSVVRIHRLQPPSRYANAVLPEKHVLAGLVRLFTFSPLSWRLCTCVYVDCRFHSDLEP